MQSMLSEHRSNKDQTYHSYLYAQLEQPLREMGFDSLDLVQFAAQVSQFFGLYESGLEDLLLRYPTLKSWCNIILDSLDLYRETITFHTKGSTGAPKAVTHRYDALWNEVAFLASLFSSSTQLYSAVRLHHVYGFLYAILLPKALKRPIVRLELMPSRAFFDTKPNSFIISTPTLYDLLERIDARFTPHTTLISSTQALAPATHARLLERGAARIYEIYGATETLGVGYRNDPQEPYTLFPTQKERDTLQDHLTWVDATHFYVGARRDGAEKVRGYKVYPA
ncbi:MAG: AMP-binding protein [Campylobacterales bacterium]|nr:AMP-binding protein [Campylobacterales bacterium]